MSDRSMTRPPDRIGKVSSNIAAVNSIDQGNKTTLPVEMPLLLRLRMVLMKLMEVRKEEMPVSTRPSMIRSPDTVERLIREVLNGGYNVQPVPPPNSLSVDSMSNTKATGSSKKEKALTLGNMTSGAPR